MKRLNGVIFQHNANAAAQVCMPPPSRRPTRQSILYLDARVAGILRLKRFSTSESAMIGWVCWSPRRTAAVSLSSTAQWPSNGWIGAPRVGGGGLPNMLTRGIRSASILTGLSKHTYQKYRGNNGCNRAGALTRGIRSAVSLMALPHAGRRR